MPRRRLVRLLVVAAIVVGALWAVDRWLLAFVRAGTVAMAPAVASGDEVVALRPAYRFSAPGRGDLVVVHPNGRGAAALALPGVSTSVRVRRVVGLPGEWIRARYGHVDVCRHGNRDCRRLDEPYASHVPAPFGPVLVPAGRYYLLADDRSSLDDSRTWGPVARSQIVGRALVVIWPLDRLRLLL